LSILYFATPYSAPAGPRALRYFGTTMPFRLRPATPADAPFLAALFREARAPEFAALNLPAAALQQFLDIQHNAQLAGYAAQFPHAESSIICLTHHAPLATHHSPETPAGRILLNRTSTLIHLIDIAIAHRFRGEGIATEVLTQLCAQARAAAIPIRLIVAIGNPAQRLYQRVGFRTTASDSLDLTMEFDPAMSGSAQNPHE